ncbi:hypothetical protein [Nostoc sp. CCY 9925]|uniref:hypothetical protein n=1 Tax=Nostoc sp. CCY 9925 TaxID=3103865 RepID=UPI0039C5CD35
MKLFQNIFILLSSVATVLTVCQTANAGNGGLNLGSERITPGLEKQYLQYQLQNNGNGWRQIRVIPENCVVELSIFSRPYYPTSSNDPWYRGEEIIVLPRVEEGEILFGSVSDTSTLLLGGEDFTGVGEISGEETFIVQGGSEEGEILFGSISDTSTLLLGGEDFTGVGEIPGEETFIVQGESFPTTTLFLPLLALLFFLGGNSGSSDTVSVGNTIVTGDTANAASNINESNLIENKQYTTVDEPSVTNAIVLLTLIFCLLRYRNRYSKGQVRQGCRKVSQT